MAYFLPSFFQKRLLRYALSRLDFIESEALNLNNLEFTIGQRSVIELKNVAIKVAKVIERLDLPASITPKHASIRILRITIPADLHASGIEVEVDGIDVSIDIDHSEAQEDKRRTKSRGKAGPSHKDVANRPRTLNPLQHDPGGTQLLPTSEGMAASFLQAEPEAEKEELTAVVASRSVNLQQSNASLDDSFSEAGTGTPEGFSLPGFVANFFAGIADRLSVVIKRVAISFSLRIDAEQPAREELKLILKVEEVGLEKLQLSKEPEAIPDTRRTIRIMGIELLVVSDGEVLARKSSPTSPKLSKSRSSTSPSLSRSATHRDGQSIHSQTNDIDSSRSSSSSHALDTGLGVYDEILDSSDIFNSGGARSENVSSRASPELSRLSPIASHGTSGRRESERPSLSPHSSQNSDGDDLAESKVFSHGEVESMFMSAMSNLEQASERMPGGYGVRSSADQDEKSSTTMSQQSITRGQSSMSAKSTADSISLPKGSKNVTPIEISSRGLEHKIFDTPDQVAKRILRVNEIVSRIPLSKTRHTHLQEQHTEQSQMPEHRRPMSSGRLADSTRHIRNDSGQSIYSPPHDIPPQPDDLTGYEISIGDVELAADIGLCHILAKALSQNLPIFQTENGTQPSPTQEHDLSAKLFVRSIVFNFMENVPDITSASMQVALTESTFDLPLDGTPLLQLQTLKIRFELLKSSGKVDQRLFIHRIGLDREAEKIITFFDPSTIQESFVASSVLLGGDDFVLRQTDNRLDITTKPVHITLDLLILDDVLSRSGGLSSLLDLGSSFASTGTIKEQQGRPTAVPGRRRSVHFDDTGAQPQADNSSEMKINMRISGAVIDLVGSESSMQIKSSAIKVVHRADKLRMNISSISIKGPIVPKTPSTDVVSARLNDLELIYLNAPVEEDLDRLLGILTPSKDKYEQDDDIMVDTLLRQRRKGGVLRLSVKDLQTSIIGLMWTHRLTKLGEEISKLSTVTKYLPEDDRPGILTFILLSRFDIRLEPDKRFRPLVLHTNLLEAAHISVPSLLAAQISSLSLTRGKSETILGELIPDMQESIIIGPPMLMYRFIADEMEPTVKLKLSNTCFEYSVPLLLAITQLGESVQAAFGQEVKIPSPKASQVSSVSSEASELSRKIKFSLELRNTAISLNPLGFPSRGLFLFTDAVFNYGTKHQTILATIEIKKASIMIIDDVAKLGHEGTGADPKLYFDQNDQVQTLVKSGYVPIGSISAAYADIKIAEEKLTNKQLIDVEFKNNLLFLETCADSTQTLFQILGGLSAPSPPSKVEKYRTEQRNIIPIEDMLASFTGNAFVSEQGPELGLQMEDNDNTPTVSRLLSRPTRSAGNDSSDDDDVFVEDLSASRMEDANDDGMTESSILSQSARTSTAGSLHIAPVNITADDEPPLAGSIMMHSLIDFRDDHFTHKTSVGGTAHRWNSTKNTYGMGSEETVQQSPLKVRVRDVHIIWNLFDGYDWQNTRDVITQAVRDVEERAYARQRRRDNRRSPGPEEEDGSVIGDVLFNSIYISIPTNKDPRDLTNAINMELGDGASETGSYATSTTVTAATSRRHSSSRYRPKRLRLNRSKQHKMTFELEGLAADFLAFPPDSGEVESSTDVRVRKLEIFDHIPTSTWKKFATYMRDAGEREVGTDMIHIELLNVKPVADLAASEIVMKLTVLPLRLHVDQDALDFLIRFFDFKDDRTPPSTTPSNPPFIQRAEVNPVQVKLDFKPKRVDYAALKSGRTTELMNFIVLDRADILLRRIILYGVSGFDRLGIMLNNIWTPDVRNNQLPTVLSGLAPVRSLVDVGSGVRDLVAIPIREYRKDGRIVRSIQKGAIAFAKTTTTELVNLGAKLAIGTQTVLQNVEGVLAPHAQQSRQTGFGSDSEDDEHQKAVSNYADQPLGIVQGLRGAYASLERDLLLAKDAIVAVPGEIMADGSATGAAKIVLKQSPTIILRPAIGVTKAMGQAFLGAGNTLDKQNRRRVEDKYKRH